MRNIEQKYGIIGQSEKIEQVIRVIEQVAPSGISILIYGESGVGKELVAKALHDLSLRKHGKYVIVNCGAIPAGTIESELFGHKKGAFTGAAFDKKGLFEVADKGVFFLDEIADISLSLQAKMLRVIQNQEIIRLGDTKVKKIDVRLIAATNQDLKQLSKTGKFREDLFYRLNVFPITIPPLRRRKSDIVLLAKHFLKK